MHIEIITPEKVVVSEDFETFEAPGVAGEFQILPEHTPFLTGLTAGPVTCGKGSKKTFVSISGGFCEVRPDKTVILAHTAELSGDIDQARAQAALKRAKERLETINDPNIDMDRAHTALMRAMIRIKVADMN